MLTHLIQLCMRLLGTKLDAVLHWLHFGKTITIVYKAHRLLYSVVMLHYQTCLLEKPKSCRECGKDLFRFVVCLYTEIHGDLSINTSSFSLQDSYHDHHASSTYYQPCWILWLLVCSLKYPLSDSERLLVFDFFVFPTLLPCWDEISPPMNRYRRSGKFHC